MCALYIYHQKVEAYTHFRLRMWTSKQSSVVPEDGTVVQAYIGKISVYWTCDLTPNFINANPMWLLLFLGVLNPKLICLCKKKHKILMHTLTCHLSWTRWAYGKDVFLLTMMKIHRFIKKTKPSILSSLCLSVCLWRGTPEIITHAQVYKCPLSWCGLKDGISNMPVGCEEEQHDLWWERRAE